MSAYYSLQEAESFVFYRIPKVLLTGNDYKAISTDAKFLYGLLLDRMTLSVKNNWVDEEEHIYLYYTIENVRTILSCGREKACRIFDELESVQLIERKRQGQGKPSKIYLKRPISEVRKSDFQKSENRNSRDPKIETPDFRKSKPNKNEMNKTEMKEINPSIKRVDFDAMDMELRKHLAFDILSQNKPKEKQEALENLLTLMVETLLTNAPTIRVGQENLSADLVKERLWSLGFDHLEYVQDAFQQTRNKIHNIRAYLLTALYNAPNTMQHFYQNWVQHDLYESAMPQENMPSGDPIEWIASYPQTEFSTEGTEPPMYDQSL